MGRQVGGTSLERENRVAFVTGAARGIGRVVAPTLAGRGYKIAANDREEPAATLGELGRAGAEALSVPGDVSDEGAAVLGMVEGVMVRFGWADALVKNAGISTIVPAEENPLADWNRTLAVNLAGPFLLSRGFGKVMPAQGRGAS